MCLSCAAAVYLLLALRLRYFTAEKVWPAPFHWFGEGRTVVFRREDLRRVWEWEVAAGHYPSRREGECAVSESLHPSSLSEGVRSE